MPDHRSVLAKIKTTIICIDRVTNLNEMDSSKQKIV